MTNHCAQFPDASQGKDTNGTILARLTRIYIVLPTMGGAIGRDYRSQFARQGQVLDGPGCDYDLRRRGTCHTLQNGQEPAGWSKRVLARHSHLWPFDGHPTGLFVRLLHSSDSHQSTAAVVYSHATQQHSP